MRIGGSGPMISRMRRSPSAITGGHGPQIREELADLVLGEAVIA